MTNESNAGINAKGIYATCKLRSGLATITIISTGIISQKRLTPKLAFLGVNNPINVLLRIQDKVTKPITNMIKPMTRESRLVKIPNLINS